MIQENIKDSASRVQYYLDMVQEESPLVEVADVLLDLLKKGLQFDSQESVLKKVREELDWLNCNDESY